MENEVKNVECKATAKEIAEGTRTESANKMNKPCKRCAVRLAHGFIAEFVEKSHRNGHRIAIKGVLA